MRLILRKKEVGLRQEQEQQNDYHGNDNTQSNEAITNCYVWKENGAVSKRPIESYGCVQTREMRILCFALREV